MTFQILVAEDEAALRDIFVAELESQYRVTTAANGREALEILRGTPDIRLLLSDIRMPEMNGFELAEEALRRDPELKVLFISAFSDEMPPASVLKAREIRILRKPFGMSKMLELVDEMMSRP